jgi:hypothetical protein
MSFYQVFGTLLDGYTPSIVLATAAVLLVCWSRLSVRVDPREPPILKPTIPYIGHIIGLFTQQSSYFEKLRFVFLPVIVSFPLMHSTAQRRTLDRLLHYL